MTPRIGPRRNWRGAAAPALFCLLAARLWAADPYLQPGHPDGVALLAPPPLAGSAEDAADLNSVRAVFKNRTPADVARADGPDPLSLFEFAPAVGPVLAPGKLPRTEELYGKVKKEIGDPVNVAKDHWKRKRPYEVDDSLQRGKPEKSPSYPSGHSTRGTVYSLVLAEIFPDQRQEILAIGRQMGWDRVLLGRHYPTDIYAGRVLAQAIFRELMASPAFQHDLAEAKAEARAEAQAVQHLVPAGQGH